jgi:hypothetical protein
VATLVGAAAAGFLLWYSPHFDRFTTSGYWGVIALMALAGGLLGLSQLHGRDGNPTASFLLAFLPVLVAAGWVILAGQPESNWIREHVLSWSDDLGIGHGVHNLGERVAVVAFGLGVVFGVTFEPRMMRRRTKKVVPPVAAPAFVPGPPPVPLEPAVDEPAAEEPVAEPVEVAESPTVVTPGPRGGV